MPGITAGIANLLEPFGNTIVVAPSLADAVERSRSYAPRGRFVEIPGVGHYAHEEAPESVNEELQRFLDSQLALLSR